MGNEIIQIKGEVQLTKRKWWQIYKKNGINIQICGVGNGG